MRGPERSEATGAGWAASCRVSCVPPLCLVFLLEMKGSGERDFSQRREMTRTVLEEGAGLVAARSVKGCGCGAVGRGVTMSRREFQS